MANKQIMSADINTKQFMKIVSLISKDALPNAAAMTLNFTADQVTKQQIVNVKNDFTIRTPWTLKSMETKKAKPYKALNKARGKNLQRMFSRAGTFSPYLWTQEKNKTIEGINGPIPIATDEARTSKSKRKAIAKRNRLKSTDILRPGKFGTGGNTFIGIPRGAGGRRYGMYKRTNRNHKLLMLRNMETKTAKITGKHFHEKAVKRKGSNILIAQRFKKYGQQEINKAVRKHG